MPAQVFDVLQALLVSAYFLLLDEEGVLMFPAVIVGLFISSSS